MLHALFLISPSLQSYKNSFNTYQQKALSGKEDYVLRYDYPIIPHSFLIAKYMIRIQASLYQLGRCKSKKVVQKNETGDSETEFYLWTT